MDPQNQPLQPDPNIGRPIPIQPENNNRLLFIILGVLAVATLVVGGIYYLTKPKLGKPVIPYEFITSYPTQPPQSTEPQSDTQTQPDELAEWKTYENNKFGYSIKYPADLVIDTSFATSPYNKISINIPALAFRIEFFDNPNNLSAKDFFQDKFNKQLQSGNPPPQEPKTSKNISINSNNAYQIEIFAFDGNERTTYLTKGNKAVIITYYSFNTDLSFNQQNVKLSDQILSTFRFVDTITKSDMIYYHNPKYKYSFSYSPQNNLKAVLCNDYGSNPVYGDERYIITDNTSSPTDDPYYTCGTQGEDHNIVVQSQQALDCQSTGAWSATYTTLKVNGIDGDKCIKKFTGNGDISTPSIIETVVIAKGQNFIQIEQFDNRAPEIFNEILSSFKFD